MWTYNSSRWWNAPVCVLRVVPVVLICCGAMAQPINPSLAGLPMGGVVTSGSITAALTPDRLTLTQSGSRAIIDWQSFHIGAGKTVEYVQPSATAAVLNRVGATAPMSDIHGSLIANGTVLLVNPNGVLFHQGAYINVGSLIVTTGRVDADAFQSGGSFGIDGVGTGSITNHGTLTANDAGLVALVAPSVHNHGAITATTGRIALAGADRATVSFNGGLYELAVPAGAQGIGAALVNAADARLEGGQILLSTGDAAQLVSGVVNLSGIQQASQAIVVDGHTVLLGSDLVAPVISGAAASVTVQPGASIQDAVAIARAGAVGTGAIVTLQPGTYLEQVILNKAYLTLQGQPGARLLVPDGAQVNGLSIQAYGVTVQGLEIAGPLDAPYSIYYTTPRNNISRGIAVADGVQDFVIRDNHLHDLRNGILIHGRNSSGSISGNLIDNTKSGISVQYTDGAGIAIAGNYEGLVGNEWGLNLHLNGHLNGSGQIVGNSPPIAAAPTPAWQQGLLALSAANQGWAVQDQGYATSNRTRVYVSPAGSVGNQGSLLTPLGSVQAGVQAVVTGGTVYMLPGTYTHGSTLTIDKPLTLAGSGQTTTLIDARGVGGGYGMHISADDVTLRDFTLYGPTGNYPSAYGIKVAPEGGGGARLHRFTIERVTSRGAGRAELDLNGVVGAVIDSVLLDGAPVGNDGGVTQGAGLQITDSAQVTVRNTVTRNNAWGGVALYQANRHYNQQVDGIRLEASNGYGEINPVYLQDESALHDFGGLQIEGFSYAVRNTTTTASGQYTWLQPTRQRAIDFAVNLPGSQASTVQGWNGSAATADFVVGVGQLDGGGTQALSLAAALARSPAGAVITVDPGQYDEDVAISGVRDVYFGETWLRSLTVGPAADGSGIGGQVVVQGGGDIRIQGGVRLLADTTLVTDGGDIIFTGGIQRASSAPAALTLRAGSGLQWGDVSLTAGGTAAQPLGDLTVAARRVSLADTLWVQRFHIEGQGDVSLSSHTLRAAGADISTLVAAGTVSGSIVSGGGVEVLSAGDVQASVTAQDMARLSGRNVTATISAGTVAVTATQTVDVQVQADALVALSAEVVRGSVSAPILTAHSTGSVDLTLDVGRADVQAATTAMVTGRADQLGVDAPRAQVRGAFGRVDNTGSGIIDANGRIVPNETAQQAIDRLRMLQPRDSTGDAPEQIHLSDAKEHEQATVQEEGRHDGGDAIRLRALSVTRSTVGQAAELLQQQRAVEIDLDPGR